MLTKVSNWKSRDPLTKPESNIDMNPFLPSDIIFNEILPLVPSEVLRTWICVCKYWFNRLYKNPTTFIDAQLAKSRPRHILNIVGKGEYSPLVDVEFVFNKSTRSISSLFHNDNLLEISKKVGFSHHEMVILGTCNGLVLLKENKGTVVHIMNPSLKQRVTIPLHIKHCFARLGGLGYDPLGKQYKAVLFFKEEGCGKCEVLTLGSNKWREIYFPFEVGNMTGPAIIVDGFMNFAYRKFPVRGHDHMLSLDVSNETVRLKKLPNRAAYLMKIGDSLGVVASGFSARNDQLDIWILKDYNNGDWTRKFRISTDSIYRMYSYIPKVCPVASCNNGEIMIFKERGGMRLFWHDATSESFNEIATYWRDKLDGSVIFSWYDHVSTLLSPHDLVK